MKQDKIYLKLTSSLQDSIKNRPGNPPAKSARDSKSKYFNSTYGQKPFWQEHIQYLEERNIKKIPNGHIGNYKDKVLVLEIIGAHLPKGARVLEIGFKAGHSAFILIDSSKEISHYLAVDIATQFPVVKIAFDFFAEKYEFFSHVAKDSKIALPEIMEHPGESQKFDLIHVDGHGLGETPMHDFVNSHKLLKVGGILILDDIRVRDVMSAYLKYFNNNPDYIEIKSGTAGDIPWTGSSVWGNLVLVKIAHTKDLKLS